MVSDEDLQTLIQTLVLHHHGPVADPSLLVHQLEDKLGLDLTHKAAFIRDHATALLAGFGFQRQGFEGSPFAHLPGRSELGFESGRVGGEEKAGGTSGTAKGRGAQPGAKKRGGPGGLNKVCGVSPELQAIVGESTMARTQIVKQLWVYIRKNNLQDPNNKRKIICNDELRLVFETDSTDMFKMNKLLAKHILPLESSKDAGPDSKRLKTTEPEPEPVPKSEPVPVHEEMLQHEKVAQHALSMLDHEAVLGHGLLPEHEAVGNYPIVLSDALAEFFGTGERQMLQSEAMKRIWDYIKANKLQGPADSMMIQFDSKLARLFGCDSLSVLGISEMLSCHMFKQS